ncbi:alpha/beta hydrolase [Pelagibacterium mangrovi]|uniref:alpha/beta hydrolase n=1 Tax=Pelagibacterium mangrovi TaxID=3119828 RepID=UPI002FC5B91F
MLREPGRGADLNRNGQGKTVVSSLWSYVSVPGLLVGALFFALSLTPSLIPRTPLVQGALSGCIFAVGYALGAVLQWIWIYLQLRLPNNRAGQAIRIGAVLAVSIVLVICLYHHTGWQNAVRAAMQLEPVQEGNLLFVALVAIIPAVLLVAIGTMITRGVQRVAAFLRRRLPPRAATLSSVVIVGTLTALLFSGVLLRGALRMADNAFEQLDAVAGQFGDAAPLETQRSGSTQSLIRWDSIGRDGRVYINTQPSRADIETLTGRPAIEPLRTYVGLRSADSAQERAHLALAEMLRIGAFDRSTLVIIMPVGTGWVDPPSIDALEYLLDGDVASVAMQYSYLTSPLSLVIEPTQGTDAAQALFDEVYGYWRTLDEDERPRLYLNGLSLGANSSQASTMFLDILGNPFDGALWVGPPFTSAVWGWSTKNRVADSPSWRPVFGDSSSVRFANRGRDLTRIEGPWGPMRIAFLQYPTDPIVFFDYDTAFFSPSWIEGERGEGVSPDFRWFPIITFLQLAMDMALSNTSPVGYGHVYSPDDYVDAWHAIVEPPGWTDESLDRLKTVLSQSSGRE